MEVSNALAGRPAYYDRTPVSKNSVYPGSGIAPHGETNRWTYTVPTAKKAFIGLLEAELMRATVAGALGKSYVLVYLQPVEGGTLATLFLEILENTVGARNQVVIAPGYVLKAGDGLVAATSDASTTGTMNYFAAIGVTEFDS